MQITKKQEGYTFTEKGHQHRFNGKRMTGVTTILGVIAKPALIGWASNMCADYILEKGTTKDKDFILITKEEIKLARKAHTRKKEAGGEVGTLVHSAIEKFLKEGKEPELDEQGMKMFENFKKWQSNNKVKFLESEKHVYSEKLFLGGIIDGVAEIDGKKWLIDFKTGGTKVYPEAFYQMGGYETLLKEMKEYEDISGYIILGIFKDGTTEEKRSISNEENMEAFISAYKLYKIIQKTKSVI